MSRRLALIFLFMLMAVLVSSLGVVYAKYASRKHFVTLQELYKERDHIDVEWRQLQLELGTRARFDRVVKIARDRLDMHAPAASEIVIAKP